MHQHLVLCRKTYINMLIYGMVVNTYYFLSIHIYNIRITLLGINKNNLIFFVEFFKTYIFLNINIKKPYHLGCHSSVDASLIAYFCIYPFAFKSSDNPYAHAIASGSGKLCVCIKTLSVLILAITSSKQFIKYPSYDFNVFIIFFIRVLFNLDYHFF